MATSLYRVKGTTNLGRDLLSTLEQIGDRFAHLKILRAAMLQQKDGAAGDASDFATPAKQFGFVDAAGAESGAIAKAAFEEIDSFVANGGPSLEQCCARLRQ